ncbi:hypothetical protein CCR75_004073 [Bremia lactucae]|uniref:Calmodulin n=1 Tax=Bremia lactucae TaxID=4779 RepID=A0A976IJ65_BRELC|nr:hypothetical protein CCR75_004073 [Bremia lactucae]
MADPKQRRKLAYALQADLLFNPDFSLTPEVIEIMQVFFADLEPDARGTISCSTLADEIARLDPNAETTRRLQKDLADMDERIDFSAFCKYVMRWKVQSPEAVQTVYNSWASQIVALDFDMTHNLFFDLKSEAKPRNWKSLFGTDQQLQQRRKLHKGFDNVNHEVEDASNAKCGLHAEDTLNPEARQNKVDNMKNIFSDATAAAANKISILTVSKSFVAGSMAGIIAKSTLAPLDRVKIIFQVNDQRKFTFRNAAKMARDIYVNDGFRALFRGNLLNIFRVIPYAGLQHSGFDYFRHSFHAYNFRKAERNHYTEMPKLSSVQLVTAGSLAGGLSLVVAYPLDIIRARYMVQMGKQRHTSIYDAVAAMYKVEGMRSFSRGLLPSILGTLPYTGIGFSLNERFKNWTLEYKYRHLEDKGPKPQAIHLNPVTKFVCSYFAACIAQTSMCLYFIQILMHFEASIEF